MFAACFGWIVEKSVKKISAGFYQFIVSFVFRNRFPIAVTVTQEMTMACHQLSVRKPPITEFTANWTISSYLDLKTEYIKIHKRIDDTL